MRKNRLTRSKIINIAGAILFTFLMPGLGQVSCGKIGRGLVIYTIGLLLLPVALFMCTQPFAPFNIMIAAIVLLGFLVLALVDSILIARNPANTLRMKPLVGYLLLIGIWQLQYHLVATPIANTVKDRFVQAYRIPSETMSPTLLIGDHILVDKRIYQGQDPKRGDIVVFPYPLTPEKVFVNRVIAVGGDTVEVKGKYLYLNGTQLSEPYAVHTDRTLIPVDQGPRDFCGPVTVSKNFLFVMGDNRDSSYDSRFWGFVKKDKVKGRVIDVYWSWDKEAGRVRWGRIGKPVV